MIYVVIKDQDSEVDVKINIYMAVVSIIIFVVI